MIKFFQKIKLIKLEVIGTIAWFLTDFMWMWGHIKTAICLLPVILISMIITIIRVKSKNLKRIVLITLMWLIMNSIWMLSDLITNDAFIVNVLKVFASFAGVIGFTQLFIFFITKPKTIRNFRRFLNINQHEA